MPLILKVGVVGRCNVKCERELRRGIDNGDRKVIKERMGWNQKRVKSKVGLGLVLLPYCLFEDEGVGFYI